MEAFKKCRTLKKLSQTATIMDETDSVNNGDVTSDICEQLETLTCRFENYLNGNSRLTSNVADLVKSSVAAVPLWQIPTTGFVGLAIYIL